VVQAIRHRVLILRDFPRAGAPLPGGIRKLSEWRYGYLVLYRLRPIGVEILRIRHAREDWR
jgi:plasmid stabilization system protein ParE